jgi:O-antigen/teichoic acid export membrane protein
MSRKADQLLIGSAIGATALGNYHVATEVSTMPTGELVMPLRRALFPTLSKLQDDPGSFREAVLQSFSALAVLCFSLGFGVAATAEEFVDIVLGAKWRAAVPLIQCLAIYGSFMALSSILEVPMWVKGKTRFSAWQAWLELSLLVPCIWISMKLYGVNGAAFSRAFIALLMFPFSVYLLSRACAIGFRDLMPVLWRPFLAGLMMAVAVMLPSSYPQAVWLALLIKIGLGASVYVSALMLFWMISGKPGGIESSALHRIGMMGRRAFP